MADEATRQIHDGAGRLCKRGRSARVADVAHASRELASLHEARRRDDGERPERRTNEDQERVACPQGTPPISSTPGGGVLLQRELPEVLFVARDEVLPRVGVTLRADVFERIRRGDAAETAGDFPARASGE